MGGMGFFPSHHAQILINNSLINIHTLHAASQNGAKRYLYTSSACVYPEYMQTDSQVTPLREADAYPAQPQDAYGWEKLVSERLCTHYGEEDGIETRICAVSQHIRSARDVGWRSRKGPGRDMPQDRMAKLSGSSVVEIWGDGKQTRSFCYIEDCVEGIYRLMQSDYSASAEPWSGPHGVDQPAGSRW